MTQRGNNNDTKKDSNLGNFGVVSSTPPSTSSGASKVNLDLSAFNDLLDITNKNLRGTTFDSFNPAAQQNQLNALSGQLGSLSGSLGTELGQFRQIAQGDSFSVDPATGQVTGGDPRFNQAAQAQLNSLAAAQQAQSAQQSNFFARRGLEGSSAALNAQNQLSTQFGNQAQGVIGQLGLQQLGRQDAARAGAAGIIGQQAGLTQAQGALTQAQAGLGFQGATQQNAATQQGLDNQTVALQNLLAEPTIQVAATAAENAGVVPPSGGKK